MLIAIIFAVISTPVRTIQYQIRITMVSASTNVLSMLKMIWIPISFVAMLILVIWTQRMTLTATTFAAM